MWGSCVFPRACEAQPDQWYSKCLTHPKDSKSSKTKDKVPVSRHLPSLVDPPPSRGLVMYLSYRRTEKKPKTQFQKPYTYSSGFPGENEFDIFKRDTHSFEMINNQVRHVGDLRQPTYPFLHHQGRRLNPSYHSLKEKDSED